MEKNTKTINGRKYIQHASEGEEKNTKPFIALDTEKSNAISCPICEAVDEFSISYGDYECFAHCKCGSKLSIYTG